MLLKREKTCDYLHYLHSVAKSALMNADIDSYYKLNLDLKDSAACYSLYARGQNLLRNARLMLKCIWLMISRGF